jgi:ABC-2 type transport system permease protein
VVIMTALVEPAEVRNARFAALALQPMEVVSSSSRPFFDGLKSVREVFSRRELLSLLIRRDLKARYKDSALGFVWSLIKPLTQLAIYYVVVGHFLGAAKGIPDFAVYVFCGLTIYSLFSETISGATSSIVTNAGLIKKIALPREVFPLASIGAGGFNFLVQLVILFVAALFLGGFQLGWNLAYAVPAIVLILIYTTAIGLFLSAVNVYLRDIQYLIEVSLMVLLWASPTVYSWTQARSVLGNGVLLELYTDNPITLAVLAFQKAFWVGHMTGIAYPGLLLTRMGIAAVIGIVLIFVAQRVFSRLEGNFAQEL